MAAALLHVCLCVRQLLRDRSLRCLCSCLTPVTSADDETASHHVHRCLVTSSARWCGEVPTCD